MILPSEYDTINIIWRSHIAILSYNKPIILSRKRRLNKYENTTDETNTAGTIITKYSNLSMMFGTPLRVEADELLQDGKEYVLGDMAFQMIATPGHTAGSCTYYFKEADVLISGDTLFEGSVGRTDFPTGSMSVLVHSIKHKLFTLPEKTICYPGHGGTTTIGWEKDNNPFIV